MGNIPAGRLAGLFASAEFPTVAGKLLPGPELTNGRQAQTLLLLAIVHLDISCKVHSLDKWQQDQFTPKWKTMNNIPIKYLHTSLMGIITLLEQVLCTSRGERKKIQFPILSRKSSNYFNFSVPYDIKISWIWQHLSKMGNDRYQICFGKSVLSSFVALQTCSWLLKTHKANTFSSQYNIIQSIIYWRHLILSVHW